MARGWPDHVGQAVIAIYVHDLSATGVVRNALDIARELAHHDHQVELVTALGGDDHRVPAGVSRHALLARPGRRTIEHIRATPRLSRYLARRRPQDRKSTRLNSSH